MANKNVETDALRTVRAAVKTYREAILTDVKKMRDAVQDCHDNLGQDEYSKKTKAELTESLGSILKAIEQAEDLEARLSRRIKELEDSV